MKRTVLVVDDEQNMQAVMRMGEPGQWRRHLTCLRPAMSHRTCQFRGSTWMCESDRGTRKSRPGLIEAIEVSPWMAGTNEFVRKETI